MKFSHTYLFAILLAIFYLPFLLNGTFFKRPHGDHAWAQCDRASVALNYFQFNYPLLEPHTHSVAYNPSGVAAGEFPLIPYFVSKIYSAWGFHEFLYRIITLAFSFTGFFIALLIARKFLKNTANCLLASVLWLMSPNITYYSTGFLPDTIALTFFIAGFYFVCDVENLTIRNVLLFVVLTSISVLLKSSTIFLVAAVYFALLYTSFQKKVFSKTFCRISLLVIPFLVCLAWLLYARNSQAIHHSRVFKLGALLPENLVDVKQTLRNFTHLIPSIYPIPVCLLILWMLYYVFRKIKAADFINVFTLLGICMWIIFFILMFRNAGHHGYYHIPFQFLVFTLSVWVLRNFEATGYKPFNQKNILVLLFIFLSAGCYFNTLNEISDHQKLINSDWMSVEPVLRRSGIKPLDKIASADDRSYNISLYLMNQRGWTFITSDRDSYIRDVLNDCDYAVLSGTSAVHNEKLKQYIGEEIAGYGSLHIYKLTHQRE